MIGFIVYYQDLQLYNLYSVCYIFKAELLASAQRMVTSNKILVCFTGHVICEYIMHSMWLLISMSCTSSPKSENMEKCHENAVNDNNNLHASEYFNVTYYRALMYYTVMMPLNVQ